MLCIDYKSGKPERFAGIGLQADRFFHLIKICQVEYSVMVNFKFEMIQRMSTHEHAGYFFFMIQQFGQRPLFTVRYLGGLHFVICGGSAKKRITLLYVLRLNHIAEPNYFFQTAHCISWCNMKILCTVQLRKTVKCTGISETL